MGTSPISDGGALQVTLLVLSIVPAAKTDPNLHKMIFGLKNSFPNIVRKLPPSIGPNDGTIDCRYGAP